jgi:hypothetical protein
VRRAGRLACGRCGPARTATGPSRPASPGYPAGPRPAPDGSGCRRIGPRTSRSRRPRTQPGCGPARCAGSARPPAQRAAASRPARSPPAAGGRSPPPAAPRRRRSAGRCCRPGSGGARGRAPGPRRAPLPRGARPRLDSRPRGRSGYAIRGWGVAAVEGVDRGGVHHRLTAPHRLFDRGRVGDIAHHGVQVGSLQTERRQRGSDPLDGADQQAHLMATLDQGRDGMGADKAGPTGDQNAHPAPFGAPEHAPAGRSAQAASFTTHRSIIRATPDGPQPSPPPSLAEHVVDGGHQQANRSDRACRLSPRPMLRRAWKHSTRKYRNGGVAAGWFSGMRANARPARRIG